MKVIIVTGSVGTGKTTLAKKLSKKLNYRHIDVNKIVKENKLYEELKQKLGEVYYVPIDVYLEEEETYQPDIIFISKEKSEIVKEDKIEGSPDLIIEILSPSTAYYDLVHKKEIYAKHGVKEYWIVDPMKKKIEVYENKNGEFILFKKAGKSERISSITIHGFEVELDAIF